MWKNRTDETTDHLWARAQARDVTAWMRIQRDWCQSLARNESRTFQQLSRPDAENIATEVLEDLYLRIQDFPTWGHAWSYASKDCHYRSLHAATQLQLPFPSGPEPADPRAQSFLSTLEYRDAVEARLRRYPDEHKREALGMVFLDGYTRTETSLALKVGKSRLQRWVLEFKEDVRAALRS